LVVDGALLVVLPAAAGGGLVAEDAVGAGDGAGVSFFSPAGAGVFSASDGGFSLSL
jgi:hypothetical protein